MARLEHTIKDLKQVINELGERFPKLADDDLFVLWFLRAYIIESEHTAAAALVGGARDKNIDAILIDDSAKAVFVVQGKYRKILAVKNETRSDVISFSEVSHRICEHSDEDFNEYARSMDGMTADRLRMARKRVLNDGYHLWLYYVTLGKVSSAHRKDANTTVRKAECDATIEFIDGHKAMLLFRDYLDGVAPPIPTMNLEMESSPNVTVNGIAQRLDGVTNIESWVFSMRGDAVASLYESAGMRLFARNIRGYLGMRTAVNDGMLKTLEKEPERFFYYNNGVTIICDAAEKKSSQGRDILQVSNPQVINGQQTTRTLALAPKQAAKGSVLVKVFCVPRDEADSTDSFDDLVSRIVAGTNWQNEIKASDLMSNDRRQIELERALRKLGYIYIRKRQSKADAKKRAGGKHYRFINKMEFAQAVAGCDLDPVVIRSGREKLFEENLYNQIFPNTDPNFYLPRYWLMREVTYCSRGIPARGYAKWLVLNYMWSHLSHMVRSRRNGRIFRIACETQESGVVVPLNRAINIAFREGLKYYKMNSGKGKEQLDISLFFKNRKNHHRMFDEYWKSASSNIRRQFDNKLADIKMAIEEFDG